MNNNLLAKRWRALQEGSKDLYRRAKKSFVNPKAWRFMLAVFRVVYIIIRLLNQLL